MPKVTKKFFNMESCSMIHYRVPDEYLDEMENVVTDWEYGDLISEGNSVIILYNQYLNFEINCIENEIPIEESFDD